MKLKRLLMAATAALTVISAAFIATPASAKDGAYASGNVGIGFVPNYPNTVPFGGSLGYQFDQFVRAEFGLEFYTMGANGSNLGSVSTFTAMPKLVLQYPFGKWVPYVEAGGGLASLSGATNWNTAVAWTAGGGLMYQMTDNFALGVGYDHTATTTQTIAGVSGSSSPWVTDSIKAIARFHF